MITTLINTLNTKFRYLETFANRILMSHVNQYFVNKFRSKCIIFLIYQIDLKYADVIA